MKKSTWFYLLMFLFVFILPSFTVPPQEDNKEKERVIHKTSTDSLLILFESPQITVKDARVEKMDGSKDQVIRELVGEFKQFNEAITAYNARSERRWSVMDRIEAETGYSKEQALNFIDQKRKLYKSYAAIAILWVMAIFAVYIKDFRRLKGLVLVPMLMCSIIAASLIVCWSYTFGGGYDYTIFWTLLNHLSP